MSNKTIPVTGLLLPPLEEFIPYLEKIWENRFLTNGGNMHHALEEALCKYLGVRHIVLFANAILAPIITLQTLRVTGEVITTPYSFVATNHALLWNGLKPIFVDIDQDSMNLDPSRIEVAVTPWTIAVLPTRRYDNLCDVEAVQWIAGIRHLKIIYDAAHVFAVRNAGGSVLRHGNLSILSFHATKVFNVFGGGTIICSDENTRQRLNHLKSFGFVDEVTMIMPGISGKLNGVGAAFGLLQLKRVDQALEQRRGIAERYRRLLTGVPGIQCLRPGTQTFVGNAYFPILVKDNLPLSRDELYQRLHDRDALVRCYFYLLINDFPMYHSLPSVAPANLPVTRSISSQVLCLPICPGLVAADAEFITGLIASAAMPRQRASN